jgi:hypothetical protein
MGHPLPHLKSIEGYAGEVSVHQMTYHFNSLHFWGAGTGEREEDVRHLPAYMLS